MSVPNVGRAAVKVMATNHLQSGARDNGSDQEDIEDTSTVETLKLDRQYVGEISGICVVTGHESGLLLAVSDLTHHCVWLANPKNGHVTLYAGVAGGPATFDGPRLTGARFAWPRALAAGPTGDLFVQTGMGSSTAIRRCPSNPKHAVVTLGCYPPEERPQSQKAGQTRKSASEVSPNTQRYYQDGYEAGKRRPGLGSGGGSRGADCKELAPAAGHGGFFSSPCGGGMLVWHKTKQLLVADAGNHRIAAVQSDATVSKIDVTTVVGSSYAGFRDDGGHERKAAKPRKVKIDVAAAVSDTAAVAAADNDDVDDDDDDDDDDDAEEDGGGKDEAAGSAEFKTSDRIIPRPALLSQPCGIALSADGLLYIADTLNHCIRTWSPSSRNKAGITLGGLRTFAGGGGESMPEPEFEPIPRPPSFHSSTPLTPHSTTSLPGREGELGAADDGEKAEAPVEAPPLAVRKKFIAPLHRHLGGQSGFRDGVKCEALFNRPKGLALVNHGKELLVADSGNDCIRLVDTKTGRVTTLLGGAPVPPAAHDSQGSLSSSSVASSNTAGTSCDEDRDFSLEKEQVGWGSSVLRRFQHHAKPEDHSSGWSKHSRFKKQAHKPKRGDDDGPRALFDDPVVLAGHPSALLKHDEGHSDGQKVYVLDRQAREGHIRVLTIARFVEPKSVERGAAVKLDTAQ